MTESVTSSALDWKRALDAILPSFGHRNWIVVADSAYPAQSKPGVETIVAGEDQIPVVRKVHEAIKAAGHIRANVYVDKELAFVTESDAPGITEYRLDLQEALAGSSVERLEHEQIIAKIDHAALVFCILVIKTTMTIPYTTVFFELACGYWSAEAEERLRQAMYFSTVKIGGAKKKR
jgi:L-fucose mutarotase/ribose pyranase (RbsD/FucU family)